MPNPSIKDEKTYDAMRKSGASKEKAARDANAAAADGRSRSPGVAAARPTTRT